MAIFFFPKRKKKSPVKNVKNSYYWDSKEFIFKHLPWLAHWASAPKGRAWPRYSFVCSQCDDVESFQITWADPEDIPCLFLALWHYLFGLGKLQRNACFLLKHHRLSSPGQVYVPVCWLFLLFFILASFREEKTLHLKVSFTYLVLWNIYVIWTLFKGEKIQCETLKQEK